MIRSSQQTIESIRERAVAGERLSFEDGLFLYEPTTPLHELGELANLVRERKNGNRAYYNINTHLNATNACVYRCTFCAFRADLRDSRAYVMSDEEILARGGEAVENGCTELHIAGGLHHQGSELKGLLAGRLCQATQADGDQHRDRRRQDALWPIRMRQDKDQSK